MIRPIKSHSSLPWPKGFQIFITINKFLGIFPCMYRNNRFYKAPIWYYIYSVMLLFLCILCTIMYNKRESTILQFGRGMILSFCTCADISILLCRQHSTIKIINQYDQTVSRLKYQKTYSIPIQFLPVLFIIVQLLSRCYLFKWRGVAHFGITVIIPVIHFNSVYFYSILINLLDQRFRVLNQIAMVDLPAADTFFCQQNDIFMGNIRNLHKMLYNAVEVINTTYGPLTVIWCATILSGLLMSTNEIIKSNFALPIILDISFLLLMISMICTMCHKAADEVNNLGFHVTRKNPRYRKSYILQNNYEKITFAVYLRERKLHFTGMYIFNVNLLLLFSLLTAWLTYFMVLLQT